MKLLHPFRYGIIYLAVHLPNTKRRMQAVELSVKSQVKSQHSTRETLNPDASNISGADSVQLAVVTFHWPHCVFSIRPIWALYVEGEKDLKKMHSKRRLFDHTAVLCSMGLSNCNRISRDSTDKLTTWPQYSQLLWSLSFICQPGCIKYFVLCTEVKVLFSFYSF